jgi:hypothetical protein
VSRVLLYNRILNGSEIRQIYNDPSNPPSSGLILRYEADPKNIYDVNWDGA